MLKPISLLAGAVMLTSTALASAKADVNKTITVLTITEPDKPTVMVDVSGSMHSGVKIRANQSIYDDGGKNHLTTTAIFKDNIEIVAKDKEGKEVSYKYKSGVAILTRTLVKASPAPAFKAAKKPKA